jgi:hypothetical protein
MLPSFSEIASASGVHVKNLKDQEVPVSAIEELKTTTKCEIVVKGESPAEIYEEAIDRWNKIFPKQAVRSSYTSMKLKTDRYEGNHCLC